MDIIEPPLTNSPGNPTSYLHRRFNQTRYCQANGLFAGNGSRTTWSRGSWNSGDTTSLDTAGDSNARVDVSMASFQPRSIEKF